MSVKFDANEKTEEELRKLITNFIVKNENESNLFIEIRNISKISMIHFFIGKIISNYSFSLSPILSGDSQIGWKASLSKKSA